MSDHEYRKSLNYIYECDSYDSCDSCDSYDNRDSYDNCNKNELNDFCDAQSYPLKYTWVLYDHTKSDSSTYNFNTNKICEFDTAIKFWQVFNNYPKPSKLFNNNFYKPLFNGKEISSLSVFKKGIIPKWEDPINILGAEVSKRKFNMKNPLEELDENWITLLSRCVSENVDNSITGVRVVDSSSVKYNETSKTDEFKLLYRIELWFDNCSKKNIIEDLFKTILNIEDFRHVYYKEHKQI